MSKATVVTFVTDITKLSKPTRGTAQIQAEIDNTKRRLQSATTDTDRGEIYKTLDILNHLKELERTNSMK